MPVSVLKDTICSHTGWSLPGMTTRRACRNRKLTILNPIMLTDSIHYALASGGLAYREACTKFGLAVASRLFCDWRLSWLSRGRVSLARRMQHLRLGERPLYPPHRLSQISANQLSRQPQHPIPQPLKHPVLTRISHDPPRMPAAVNFHHQASSRCNQLMLKVVLLSLSADT